MKVIVQKESIDLLLVVRLTCIAVNTNIANFVSTFYLPSIPKRHAEDRGILIAMIPEPNQSSFFIPWQHYYHLQTIRRVMCLR